MSHAPDSPSHVRNVEWFCERCAQPIPTGETECPYCRYTVFVSKQPPPLSCPECVYVPDA